MEVGTWKPGVPGVMSWQPGAMDMIQKFRPREKLRVIVVEQPPFVEWNEDRRKNLEEIEPFNLDFCILRNV